ncbi:ABC transporter permease [Bifidobacterium aquikefiri]|uniref:ABC transporter permease n=1 Tax=Bifidobacterium aquikefiri TaxID=1653207 RepID=UPI0039EBEF44
MSVVLASRKGAIARSRVKQCVAWCFTLLGFAVALAVAIVAPSPAKAATTSYDLAFGLVGSGNGLYAFMLVVLMVCYSLMPIIALVSGRKGAGLERHLARYPFRVAVGLALCLWNVLGDVFEILPRPFFPGPAQIAGAFLEDSAFILHNTLYSLRLFAVGFIVGVLFGVSTGIIIGWFAKAYYWVFPVLKITGVIPAVAWMPFALTSFPTPFAAAAFLIVICEWFPIAFLTAQGVRSTPKQLYEAARTLGAGQRTLVFRVAVPHALPNIFTGISTANAYAFATLVMSEMMGQPGGLGYYINSSKVWSAYYKVFAAIVVMAVLFSLILKLTERVQRHALRWQRGLIQ